MIVPSMEQKEISYPFESVPMPAKEYHPPLPDTKKTRYFMSSGHLTLEHMHFHRFTLNICKPKDMV
jgi:hypothetical protein